MNITKINDDLNNIEKFVEKNSEIKANIEYLKEPHNYQETIDKDSKNHWINAIKSEIKGIQENKTWTLTTLLKNHKVISFK